MKINDICMPYNFCFMNFFVGDLLQGRMVIGHSGPSHLGLKEPPKKVHNTEIVEHPKINDKKLVCSYLGGYAR